MKNPNMTFVYDDIVHVLQNTKITLKLKRVIKISSW